MARRSQRNIRLDENARSLILEERVTVKRLADNFTRKGIANTYWHKRLAQLDAALAEFEGAKEDGEQMG